MERYGATACVLKWTHEEKLQDGGEGWLFAGNEYSTAWKTKELGALATSSPVIFLSAIVMFFLWKIGASYGRVYVLHRIAVALRCVKCYVLLWGYAADKMDLRRAMNMFRLVSNDFFRFGSRCVALSFFADVCSGWWTVRIALPIFYRALIEAMIIVCCGWSRQLRTDTHKWMCILTRESGGVRINSNGSWANWRHTCVFIEVRILTICGRGKGCPTAIYTAVGRQASLCGTCTFRIIFHCVKYMLCLFIWFPQWFSLLVAHIDIMWFIVLTTWFCVREEQYAFPSISSDAVRCHWLFWYEFRFGKLWFVFTSFRSRSLRRCWRWKFDASLRVCAFAIVPHSYRLAYVLVTCTDEVLLQMLVRQREHSSGEQRIPSVRNRCVEIVLNRSFSKWNSWSGQHVSLLPAASEKSIDMRRELRVVLQERQLRTDTHKWIVQFAIDQSSSNVNEEGLDDLLMQWVRCSAYTWRQLSRFPVIYVITFTVQRYVDEIKIVQRQKYSIAKEEELCAMLSLDILTCWVVQSYRKCKYIISWCRWIALCRIDSSDDGDHHRSSNIIDVVQYYVVSHDSPRIKLKSCSADLVWYFRWEATVVVVDVVLLIPRVAGELIKRVRLAWWCCCSVQSPSAHFFFPSGENIAPIHETESSANIDRDGKKIYIFFVQTIELFKNESWWYSKVHDVFTIRFQLWS